MCGIAGIHRLTNRPLGRIDALAAALLDGIEERGMDATGYVAINDVGDVQMQKASCRAFYFNANRASIGQDARTVLLHTRFATQGKAAFPENNHPVECAGVYAVHNGHIWNDREIFDGFGKTRRGQVDSECIPALVAAKGWDSFPAGFDRLDGDMAAALASVHHPGELILVRGNSSPLVYVKTNDLIVWASTSKALMDAWRTTLGTPPSWSRVTLMPEGSALRVRGGKLETVRWEPPRYVSMLPAKVSTWLPSWKAHDPKKTLAASWDDEEEELGIDVSRCEDCGDWFPCNDIELVPFQFGTVNELCAVCAEWAREAGMTLESKRIYRSH
jgi:asparagine synthetase B (glutamine-hydrolysing)